MDRSRRNFENRFLQKIQNETALNRTDTNHLSISTGYSKRFCSKPENKSIKDIDLDYNQAQNFSDTDVSSSLCLSLRSLGIDSTSYESITNMYSNSYLMSKQNELSHELDILKVSMQPTQKLHENCLEKSSEIKTVEKMTKFLPGIFWKKWTVDPTSRGYLFWLAVVSIFYVYNIFSITVRYTFLEEPTSNVNKSNGTSDSTENGTIKSVYLQSSALEQSKYLFYFDYVADFVFLIDIFLVQTRIKFLREGLWLYDFRETSCYYFKSKWFIVSLVINSFI